jgi:hypothetical protein
MVRSALIATLSVGIVAATVGVEPVNAQYSSPPPPYSPPTYASPTSSPQSRRSVRSGVPRTAPMSNPNSPAATGGGSLGYNQNLYNW